MSDVNAIKIENNVAPSTEINLIKITVSENNVNLNFFQKKCNSDPEYEDDMEDIEWFYNYIDYLKKLKKKHQREQSTPIQYRYGNKNCRHIGNQRHLYSYEKRPYEKK